MAKCWPDRIVATQTIQPGEKGMNVTQRKGLQRFKKSCMVVLLAAGLLMGAAGGAKAIDFKAQGVGLWALAWLTPR